MKLRYTDEALEDLKHLRDFIAQRNPEAAVRIGNRLDADLMKLKAFPYLGRKVENTAAGEIRDSIIGNYIARYMITPGVIFILRIWHQKEDFPGR